MSCEDEVSYRMYSFFIETRLRVLHWHPPGGKKYFTSHLRIPRFSGSARIGRYLVDLILANNEVLLLIECKCRLSESSEDLEKLRSIRDDAGFEKLKTLFLRQGASVEEAKTLMLGVGVKYIDAPIPHDFVVFETKSPGVLVTHWGSSICEEHKQRISEAARKI